VISTAREPGAARKTAKTKLKSSVRTSRLNFSKPDALLAAAHRDERQQQSDPAEQSDRTIVFGSMSAWHPRIVVLAEAGVKYGFTIPARLVCLVS
jgi:hypothetical protein